MKPSPARVYFRSALVATARTGRKDFLIARDQMIKVTVQGDEPLEKTIRRFKKRCEKEGLVRESRRAAYYEKPSERRRRAQRKSRKSVAKGI